MNKAIFSGQAHIFILELVACWSLILGKTPSIPNQHILACGKIIIIVRYVAHNRFFLAHAHRVQVESGWIPKFGLFSPKDNYWELFVRAMLKKRYSSMGGNTTLRQLFQSTHFYFVTEEYVTGDQIAAKFASYSHCKLLFFISI